MEVSRFASVANGPGNADVRKIDAVFEANDNSEFVTPALRYFLQLLVFCPVILLVSVPFSILLSIVGLSGEYPSHTHFAGYEGIVCLFVGIAIGWTVGRKVPSLVPVGRWIWVLPAVVVFSDVIREGLSSQPVPWLPEYFFATGDNESLSVLLLMLPTFSAIGYSTGMTLVGKKMVSLTSLSPTGRVVTLIAVWLALFGLLVFAAHSFGRSRIEMWSRVRTVIDRSGLSLSADANQLCTSHAPIGLLLPAGTMVEGLERRSCFNGRLLDKEASGQSGSWSVERIRVLSGSRVGAEGWVLAYGLLETLQHGTARGSVGQPTLPEGLVSTRNKINVHLVH